MSTLPAVLSIHAVDTTGEEGILADATVCTELQCRHAAVATSVLVSRPGQVDALEGLSLGLIAQQFEAVMSFAAPAAARTGVLRDPRQIELIAELLDEYEIPLPVIAPVVRVGGVRILDDEALEATRRHLYPRAHVVIARIGDLQVLSGRTGKDVEGMKRASARIREHGARAALVAGAIWRGRVLDLLDEEGTVSVYDASRIAAPRVGGLPGAHAAAVAAHLARGLALPQAADAAQRYIGFRLQRAL